MGEKHGKAKKGARHNRKLIAKDVQVRMSRTVPEIEITIRLRDKEARKFWYWRRGAD